MSDPVTNVEIEDVLSSIRRLVSEDSRPKFDRQALEHQDIIDDDATTEPAPQPEKLILTAALRVADPVRLDVAVSSQGRGKVVDFAPNEEAQEPHDLGETNDYDAEFQDASDLEESMEPNDDSGDETNWRPLSETPDSQELDAHQAAAQENVQSDPIVHEDEQDGSHEGPYVADIEALVDDQSHATQEEDATHDRHETLETRIAEVENAVADRDDQWEPDGEGEGDNAAEPVEMLPWEDHIDDRAPQDVVAEAPETHDISNDANAEIADGGDDVQDDVQDDAHQETGPEEGIANADMFAAEEAVLDEEALREMVSEIVRQELQGALGERITRNVRKLVRREIHRALASQDLE